MSGIYKDVGNRLPVMPFPPAQEESKDMCGCGHERGRHVFDEVDPDYPTSPLGCACGCKLFRPAGLRAETITNSRAARGFFGIGVFHPKTEENVGTLWRHARLYGASYIFTIGRRYRHQPTDTSKTWLSMPLLNFPDYQAFNDYLPYNCQVVCVELADRSVPLPDFEHPEQCVYLLGAEDHGLPESILHGKKTVQIPALLPQSMNVSTSGTLVMYDRFIKARRRTGSIDEAA